MSPGTATSSVGHHPPRLLDCLRSRALEHGHGPQQADEFAAWTRRYVLFHGCRHPSDLGLTEVGSFLEHVARTERHALAAIESARDALQFLYGEVLAIELGEFPRARPPRLMDRARQVLRVRHYSPRTEECYVGWMERFIRFHGMRHPRELSAHDVEQFLTDLAVRGSVSASTQNQALNAVIFLYRQVLEIDLGRFDAVRARRGKRLPVVLSSREVQRVLACVEGGGGVFALMARLLYGCGLRLIECCRLRMKDIEFDREMILVRGGKGDKDRVVMLPRSVKRDLQRQMEERRRLHERDVAAGVARVELPGALERKYPAAARELSWQFVFASRQLSRCPRTQRLGRHHVFDASVQRAVARAGRAAGLEKAIHCHTFRHRPGRVQRVVLPCLKKTLRRIQSNHRDYA